MTSTIASPVPPPTVGASAAARASLVLLLIGATVGTGLDALHTHSGTTAYAQEWLAKMSAWTPVVFAGVGLATGLAYPLAERLLGRTVRAEHSWAKVLAGFAFFAALYAASGYLPASNTVKLAALAAGGATLYVVLARTPVALLLAILTALIGSLVESALVHAGFFRYTNPDVAGIPVWLPALYVCGSVAFGAVGLRITRSFQVAPGVPGPLM
jgi:hypothetical protein